MFTSIELGSGNAFILKVMLVAIFSISLLSLFYGNIVYQLTRIGQLKRHWNHRDDYSNIEALHRLLMAADSENICLFPTRNRSPS